MKKGTKWAIIAVSCCLLASLARACAPKYDQTAAQPTNNQTTSHNYREEFGELQDKMDEFAITEPEETTEYTK